MITICGISEVVNLGLPTRHESRFTTWWNRQPVGATSRAPLYTPPSRHPTRVFIFMPGCTFTSFHKALYSYSIRYIEILQIILQCRAKSTSSKADTTTHKALVCAHVCVCVKQTMRDRERERASARPSAADCFCTLAHHVNVERSRLCAASRTCEKRDQRSHTQRESARERAPMQRVCVRAREWVHRTWVCARALACVCVHKNGNKLTQCGAWAVVVLVVVVAGVHASWIYSRSLLHTICLRLSSCHRALSLSLSISRCA